MKTTLLNVSALALLASLSACGDAADPGKDAGATAVAEDPMAMSGPFAEAETRMSERMMAAVGSDAGQSWGKKMIEHHQGAIDMSRIVLDQNPTAEVATMARDAIAKNERDNANIRKLLKDGAPDQQSADLYRGAMTDMRDRMMAASGADVSETYMRKMHEHHKGAVAMSDVALANGVSGAMRDQVQRTRSEQQRDVAMTEAMLRGEPMSEAKAAAAAPSPAATPARPTASARPKASPRPSPTPTPTPADMPPGHDMDKM